MKRIIGLFYLTGAFTLAGTSVISAHFVIGKLGTFTITAISLTFSFLCLLPFCHQKVIKNVKLMRAQDFFFLLLQAFFGIFLFRMLLLFGLLHTSSGEAGVLTGATPAATTLFAWVFLKERISKTSLIGIFCTVGGILLIQDVLLHGSSFAFEHFFGNILVLCAALCESLFNIFSRMNSLKSNHNGSYTIDPIVQTTMVSGIALILCLIPACLEHPAIMLLSIGIKEWLALAWYGFFVTAAAFIFWYAGIKRCTASTAAAFSGMMPFTALILSVLFLGEAVSILQWLGGLLVILGMFLIGGRTLTKKAIKAITAPSY